MSPTGQLTFIGVAGDAFVVDVIPTARQVWLGISLDLDGTESVVTLRVEAPVYDHSLTITVPAGPTNTSFMLPVTVPAVSGALAPPSQASSDRGVSRLMCRGGLVC